MSRRRVVVTGMAGLSPLGSSWPRVSQRLREQQSGICIKEDYAAVEGLKTRLAAPVPDFEKPSYYPRRKTRSMGRVSLLATRATELALLQAGLLDHPLLESGRCGIAYGSTSGSPPAIEAYAQQIGVHHSLNGITGAQFVRLMSHTTAANLAQFFGVMGRVVPTNSACTSGSQGIGYGFESIAWGLQDVMIAGGAEELHVICTAVFDVMHATSTRNSEPHATPRPFDAERDGLVIGEGAATLILEALEHAESRGAQPIAEVIGFATNGDGRHIVQPTREDMARVMRAALKDAGLQAHDIDAVSLHGTATDLGDVAESLATYDVFGDRPPVYTLKSYMGHTLGACGSLEAWVGLLLMQEGWLPPNLNLNTVDPECAPLNYTREVMEHQQQIIMSNNFAFGGVNTSLILKKWSAN